MGGLIWGISSALHEATEIDRAPRPLHQHRSRRISDPGERRYRPGRGRSSFPEEDRQINALGIKGIGELGNVGTNAAVANAVYHATGIRVRELPIRLEKLLDAPAIAI